MGPLTDELNGKQKKSGLGFGQKLPFLLVPTRAVYSLSMCCVKSSLGWEGSLDYGRQKDRGVRLDTA